MGIVKSVGIDEILKRGSIKDADVARLRRAIFESADIEPVDATALFELNEKCPVKDSAWADFFIEAITDYIVNQAKPEGYITAENAQWLIGQISHGGRVESKTELELLVNVLDKARWSPASLARFALEQVKIAVLTGEGPLRAGLQLEKGRISEGEVELLRRILYAFGGDGCAAVTRPEAEILFDINDVVSAEGEEISPEWTDLFIKAVANVMMASSGYKVPTREEALQHETWLESRGDLSPVAFLGAMLRGGLADIWSKYREQSWEEKAIARLERQRVEIVTNEEIGKDEAAWLADRLCRDGKITPVEEALLAHLHAECRVVHPDLAARIGAISKAA